MTGSGWPAAKTPPERCPRSGSIRSPGTRRARQTSKPTIDLEARIARLERLLGANGITTTDGQQLSGEEALAWLNAQQMSIYAGLAYTQLNLGKVADALTSTASAVQTTAQAAGAPITEDLDIRKRLSAIVSRAMP